MALNIHLPENTIMKPEITVFGVGGAGGNATNNMIKENLEGVNFVVANTDAQALDASVAKNRIQLGQETTRGLGAGATPEVGRLAAEEAMPEIIEHLKGSNMVFITAGMGGGTGTGAAPVVARAAREMDILTVGVVTKPFHFEGPRRMRLAEEGLEELQKHVDTLIVIPNQNLFRIANERTTFADAFKMADNVLHRGVRGVTDLMIMPGLINLDFADVKAVMGEMGKAMMGTGEAEGERRAQEAAEAAISNPLLDNVSMKGARGVLINITGGSDMTLFEVDEAANRIREEVDVAANIIFGSTFNDSMEGKIRVSVVATGIDSQSTASSAQGRKSYAAAAVAPAAFNAPVEQAKPVEAAPQAQTTYAAEDNSSYTEEAAEEEDSFEDIHVFEDEDENDYVEEAEAEEEEQEYAEPTNKYAELELSSVIADGITPSNVDDEYFAAIKKLNEEYKARLALEKQKQEAEAEQAEGNFFVSPSPVQPSNYVESNNAYDDHSYHAEEEKAQGGLFSRMARVARSLSGNEPQYEQQEREPEKATVAAGAEEDLMDIPAFLRRKA